LNRNFPGATYHAVYEAGYSGFWIHDRLREKGIDCIVVNPADIPTTDKERSGKPKERQNYYSPGLTFNIKGRISFH